MDDLEGRALALVHRLEGERDLLRREVAQLEEERDDALLDAEGRGYEIEAMRPVVDAAVAFVGDLAAAGRQADRQPLIDACHAYVAWRAER